MSSKLPWAGKQMPMMICLDSRRSSPDDPGRDNQENSAHSNYIYCKLSRTNAPCLSKMITHKGEERNLQLYTLHFLSPYLLRHMEASMRSPSPPSPRSQGLCPPTRASPPVRSPATSSKGWECSWPRATLPSSLAGHPSPHHQTWMGIRTHSSEKVKK